MKGRSSSAVTQKSQQRCLETILNNNINCWPTWWWELSEQRCSSCNCVSFPKPTGAQAHCAWYPEAELFPYATSIIAGLEFIMVFNIGQHIQHKPTEIGHENFKGNWWPKEQGLTAGLFLQLTTLPQVKKQLRNTSYRFPCMECVELGIIHSKRCVYTNYWPCLLFILLFVDSEKNMPDFMTLWQVVHSTKMPF